MNDIKTLLLTTIFLVGGGGLLFFLKSTNDDDSDDAVNMIKNDQDYISKEVRPSRKKRINKSTKYYEEQDDNVDNVDNVDNIDNKNDEDYIDNDYDSEEHVKPKTKTILQAKTKKNKGKQTFSKKRYY